MKILSEPLMALPTLMGLVTPLPTTATAAPPRTATVLISCAQVGETLELTATTRKRGSTRLEEWSGGASDQNTTLSPEGYYVSRATFTPTTPGEHTVSYTITMADGDGGIEWVGMASLTATLAAPEDAAA